MQFTTDYKIEVSSVSKVRQITEENIPCTDLQRKVANLLSYSRKQTACKS